MASVCIQRMLIVMLLKSLAKFDHLPALDQTLWRDTLSQLLESTGEGIFGIDMQVLCTFINRAGAEQLG